MMFAGMRMDMVATQESAANKAARINFFRLLFIFLETISCLLTYSVDGPINLIGENLVGENLTSFISSPHCFEIASKNFFL